MSIADKLEKLTTDIKDCYDAVEEKGGTLPEHKNTNNLPDAIRSIEGGGGGDDPGEWGLIEYYDSYDLDITEISGDNCSASVEDSSLLLKTIMSSPRFSGNEQFYLSFDFMSPEGWRCWDLREEPFTTEELRTECGIAVTDFDEKSASWARIMIEGKISPTPGIAPTKRLLESEEEYESLTNGGSAIVPIASIVKFSFGRLCSSVPDNFLNSARKLEYIDTTYANNVVEIGNSAFQNCSKLVCNLTFPNVTTVGNNVLSNGGFSGTLTLPKAEVVGNYAFSSFFKPPIMPKIRIVGDGFLQRFHGDGINFAAQYPAMERMGRDCLRYSKLRNFTFSPASSLPNLQYVGAGLGCAMSSLEYVEIASGLIDCFEADTGNFRSFGIGDTTLTYLAGGIRLQSDNRQVIINKFPEVTSGAILLRKWRS